LNSSNSMWYRCDGTYTILMGTPCSLSVTMQQSTLMIHCSDTVT
jgi:hypothetical protein